MAFLLAAALWASPAHAQDMSGAAPADPAWQLYDQAFERLVANDADSARALLERLREQFPGHPAAAQAAFRLTDLDGSSAGAPEPGDRDTPRPPGVEPKSSFARAELTLTMTINGVFMGYQACRMFGCLDEYEDSSRSLAASVMIGGGAGLGLTLYLTRDGITQGQAQILSSSMTWGTWNSLLLYDEIDDDQVEAGMGLAFQAAGLGAGLLLDRAWRPTSGEVAVANTAGVWGTVLTALAFGMAEREPDLTTLVIVGDLSLALGGLLGSRLPGISRGRTLLIDTGGILGLLAGGLLAVASGGNDESDVFVPLFVGTVAGLGVASFATRNWDVHVPGNARLSIAPMGRQGWGAALALDMD